MDNIINGKEIARLLREDVKIASEEIFNKHTIKPGLSVILVGEDPASKVYVNSKAKQTKETGMNSFEYIFPSDVTEEKLLEKIKILNNNPKINGILVQLPLPSHIKEENIINNIDSQKDVDGFHVINSGELFTNTGSPLIPCTPYGSLMLIQEVHGKDLSGLNAVIIGRSNIVGKPMASLLLEANATITIVHSRTKDIKDICKKADILVAAIGKAEFIDSSWIKKGATVIDVGINQIKKDGENKLVGDVNFNNVKDIAKAITPVPGGVGPMTISVLLYNTVIATCKQNNIPIPTAIKKYSRS